MLGHAQAKVDASPRLLLRELDARLEPDQCTKARRPVGVGGADRTCLDELFEQLPAGIVVLGPDGRIRRSNPAAAALLGEPLAGEPWCQVIERAFAPRPDDGHDLSLPDGRRVAIDTRALQSEPGQLLLITDVSETRRLQESVSRRERLSTLGQMMSALAHQVRSPLTAALLYANHLQDSALPVEQSRLCARKILMQLRDLERLVRELLVFARGGGLQRRPVLVSDLLLAVADQTEHRCLDAGGRLKLRCDRDLVLLGSHEALQTALENLVINALEAAGDGARVEIAAARKSHDRVVISVTDNGPGVSAQDAGRVFDAFHTTRGDGTGLGLAVVRAVVEGHGGRVDVERTAAGGACFCIALPAAVAPVEIDVMP